MGLKIAKEATEVVTKAGMPLCRWRTNDAELQESLAKLNQDERVEETMEFHGQTRTQQRPDEGSRNWLASCKRLCYLLNNNLN